MFVQTPSRRGALPRRGRTPVAWLAPFATLIALEEARADGPPLFIDAASGSDPIAVASVVAAAGTKRTLVEPARIPKEATRRPEELAATERRAAIARALETARANTSEAAFGACVKEAGTALGDANALLSEADAFDTLRDLHVQLGVCLTLDGKSESAAPHFTTATLLDETPPRAGLFREEAESARAAIRASVLSRASGKIAIDTDPPGAKVWIDGRPQPGVTPLEVEVRLGDHFVTVRRFRFESQTDLRFLQPSAKVSIALDPARRATLGKQLAAGERGTLAREPALALAAFSRADQLLRVEPIIGSLTGARLTLFDSVTGKQIRTEVVADGKDDEAVRTSVCRVLGERCEAESEGVPWYVWPIAGTAVVGGVLAITFFAVSERDVRLCPANGCP